ncbi:hypothetical protein BV20DRAFT_692525 [Pilatotrama ljubarskyi]|nr:hypothetical protein BV20DRAFT_692525 [Pilatotrama ljubarskyi]
MYSVAIIPTSLLQLAGRAVEVQGAVVEIQVGPASRPHIGRLPAKRDLIGVRGRCHSRQGILIPQVHTHAIVFLALTYRVIRW